MAAIPFFRRSKAGVFPNTSGWFIVHAALFKCSLYFPSFTGKEGGETKVV